MWVIDKSSCSTLTSLQSTILGCWMKIRKNVHILLKQDTKIFFLKLRKITILYVRSFFNSPLWEQYDPLILEILHVKYLKIYIGDLDFCLFIYKNSS